MISKTARFLHGHRVVGIGPLERCEKRKCDMPGCDRRASYWVELKYEVGHVEIFRERSACDECARKLRQSEMMEVAARKQKG